MRAVARAVVLTVRFALELAALAVAAVAGWGAAGWIGAVAAPVAVALAWGAFVSPKARFSLPLAARLAVEAVVFGGAALALWWLGRPVLAAAFGAVAAVTSALNAVQERSRR